jgi:hypothetical protein
MKKKDRDRNGDEGTQCGELEESRRQGSAVLENSRRAPMAFRAGTVTRFRDCYALTTP